MRRELFTPVGDRVQRSAQGRARLGALAVTTALGLVVSVSLALPASATRPGDGRPGHGWPPMAASCQVVASSVVGGTATFTVGPFGCDGRTPPLSFSTYTLKNGLIEPFTSQVAFAHAAGNGATYGAGSYTLEAPLPDCNWQADLYIGPSQPSAPHIHPLNGMNVGWDFKERQVCAPAASPSPSPTGTPPSTPSPTGTPTSTPSPTGTPTATPSPTGAPSAAPSPTATPTASPSEAPRPPVTPSAAPSVPPTASPAATPSATPSATPVFRSEVLSAGVPTPKPTPSPSTTYVSEVLDAQANLASTGSSTGPVLGGAAVLLVAGGLLVTLRRRSGQRS